MSGIIALPLWLVALLAGAALVTAFRHLILPVAKLYLRIREQKLNQQLSTQLSRPLPEVLRISRKARIELFVNQSSVKQAVSEAVADNQGTAELLEYKVQEYAKELTPGFYSLFYFKIGYVLARAYIRLLYDVKIVKPPSAAIANIADNASVVLVGNHRSNLDVMLLAYLSSRTSMVSFAAGEWARAWPMSSLLHLFGSYIIRRSEPLPLYRKILAIHMRNLVKAKMPQGIFLEGQLSRDGATQPLKLGLMSYILSAYNQKNVDDIVFIPVAFNYTQVPEDKTLLKNQGDGFVDRSKLYTVLTTFWSLLIVGYKKIRRGNTAYGVAAVSYGEPVSMRDWLADKNISSPMDAAQKHKIVAPIAEAIMDQIRCLIPVLSVSIVASVIFESKETTLSEQEIRQRAAELLQRPNSAQAKLAFDKNKLQAAIRSGIDALLLRKILIKQETQYRLSPDGEPLLDYLYTTTKHLLAEERK